MGSPRTKSTAGWRLTRGRTSKRSRSATAGSAGRHESTVPPPWPLKPRPTVEFRMRVLLIEDDGATAQSIELMLKSESFNVYTTDLGEEGLDLGKLYDYDIILLDLNLPDMHGYDVLKKLRLAKVGAPVLILSGISEMDSKVRALGFGADDYVTKPFHRDELVARIHAIVRRSKGHSQSVIRTGKLAVNLDAKTVEVDGSRVH